MVTLTKYQKDFILTFFITNDFKDWSNIATSLIDTGSCIVGGKYSIWVGGVGNFVKTSPVENCFNCWLYEFDLIEFMNTDWFKSEYNLYLNSIIQNRDDIDAKIADIEQLMLIMK